MKRTATAAAGMALLAGSLMLGGCDGLSAVSLAGKRPAGRWKQTTIVVQKYNQLVFLDKQSGKVLSPEAAQTKPAGDVTLEAAEFEDLTYHDGRYRYASYSRDADAQPYVVEREAAEKEFEALDEALYADKFFGFELKNWDRTTRLPMFFVQYGQGDKGWKASFSPSLAKLPKTNRLVSDAMRQLSGEAPPPRGTTQISYALSAEAGTLSIGLSSSTVDADGDAVASAWKLTSAEVDTGAGFAEATLSADKKRLTLPQPQGDGPFTLIGVRVSAEDQAAPYQSVIPVRTK